MRQRCINSFAYKDSVVVSAAFLLDVIKGLSEMTKFCRRPATIEVGLGSRKGGGITGALVYLFCFWKVEQFKSWILHVNLHETYTHSSN